MVRCGSPPTCEAGPIAYTEQVTSERLWQAGRPVDLIRTLGPLTHGAGDPVHCFDASGAFWWAVATPLGDGTLRVQASRGEVHAQAWGAGAPWLLDRVPALLGAHDEWTSLDLAALPGLADVLRRYPGMRLPASGRVMDSLVPAVLEQRVTGREAKRSWRQLVLKHGAPAPGPVDTLRLAPTPAALLQVPTWDWHRFGVDIQRQRAIRAAAAVAHRLEEITALDLEAGERRLRFLPGIGVWTAAETMQRALGHPDLVSVGDFHLANVVVHHLTGQARGTDEEMLELLEPWRGQRQRVVRLIELSAAAGPPKFAPRYAPRDMRAM